MDTSNISSRKWSDKPIILPTANDSNGKADERSNRSYYKYYIPIQTRWMDNDMYGHVNNVQYYSYFDTVINEYLIKYGNLQPNNRNNEDPIGYCVSSNCIYKSAISFPTTIEAGLTVEALKNTSVVYS